LNAELTWVIAYNTEMVYLSADSYPSKYFKAKKHQIRFRLGKLTALVTCHPTQLGERAPQAGTPFTYPGGMEG